MLTAFVHSAEMGRSVVQVLVYSQTPIWDAPWRNNSVGASSGSGFVIKGNRVMTNAHVVTNSPVVKIMTTYVEHQALPVTVVSVCHDRDLALLKVQQK